MRLWYGFFLGILKLPGKFVDIHDCHLLCYQNLKLLVLTLQLNNVAIYVQPPTKKRKSEQVKLDAGRVYDSKRYFIMMAIKSKYSTVNIIQCVVLLVWSSCYMMDI